jgi:hypothetical protein
MLVIKLETMLKIVLESRACADSGEQGGSASAR